MTQEISVNVWKTGGMELHMLDLPGQPEFYVSHHQFLPVGSQGIFIVVVWLDKHLQIEYQFHHWLSVIEAQQDNSIVSKIILVGTCLDVSSRIEHTWLLKDLQEAFHQHCGSHLSLL